LTDCHALTATDIAGEIVKGSTLLRVYLYVLEGWLQKGVSEELKPFYLRRDQLSTDEDCFFVGNQSYYCTSLMEKSLADRAALNASWNCENETLFS